MNAGNDRFAMFAQACAIAYAISLLHFARIGSLNMEMPRGDAVMKEKKCDNKRSRRRFDQECIIM